MSETVGPSALGEYRRIHFQRFSALFRTRDETGRLRYPASWVGENPSRLECSLRYRFASYPAGSSIRARHKRIIIIITTHIATASFAYSKLLLCDQNRYKKINTENRTKTYVIIVLDIIKSR